MSTQPLQGKCSHCIQNYQDFNFKSTTAYANIWNQAGGCLFLPISGCAVASVKVVHDLGGKMSQKCPFCRFDSSQISKSGPYALGILIISNMAKNHLFWTILGRVIPENNKTTILNHNKEFFNLYFWPWSTSLISLVGQ